ncbi:MAG: ATPase [Planctomycetes bacterium]|nr:ATPase [Planctomycetota bacterium]
MRYFCGIDIGASAAKLVLIDETRKIAAKSLRNSGVDYAHTAERCLDEALSGKAIARRNVIRSFATGYGRENVPWANGARTEIACHGAGAHFHFPRRMTVIDIGAQDSKMIHLDDSGARISFKMNRKCAAGTGAFLEEIAHRLDLDVSELNDLAEQSTREVTLGSFCTVFTATEILSKIRAGEKVEDIAKGAFRSVVKRVLEMDTIDGAIVATGGVIAHNPILVKLMEESFGAGVLVPPDPQYTGAFGAALFAWEQTKRGG